MEDLFRQSIERLFGANGNDVSARLDSIDCAKLSQLLFPQPPCQSEQLARLVLGRITPLIPPAAYRALTLFLKKIRNTPQSIPELTVADFSGNEIINTLVRTIPFTFWGEGKRCCLALCHDVDSKAGYSFLPELTDELMKRKLTSSFYFLSGADYRVTPSRVSQLQANGFEVSLHGLTHDIGIAYRSKTYIRNWLAKAIDLLGVAPIGFRSPGLAVSDTLLAELGRAGFVYDSSMQYGSSLYHSTEFTFPYLLPFNGLVEAPVWFQDCYLFRDSCSTTEQAISWCRKTFSQLKEQNGLVVFLMHPDNMIDQKEFMHLFLDFVKEEKENDVLVCPLDKVITRFNNPLAL